MNFSRFFLWSFFITLPLLAQQPVQIVAVSPIGQTHGRAEADRIVVTFNQPMVALAGLAEKPSTVGPFTISPAVPGIFRWLGTGSVEFQPNAPLPLATKFTVTVNAGIKSIAGGALAQNHIWTFETLRPQVIRTLPGNDAKWVGLDSEVYLSFNQPVDAAALTNFITITASAKKQAGKARTPGQAAASRIAFRIRHANIEELKQVRALGDQPQTVVILTPLSPFPQGQQITVTAQEGLPAIAGPLGMASPHTVRFTTLNTFTFDGWDPKTPTPPVAEITFHFSNPVSVADLVAHLRFKPEIKIPEYYKEWTWSQESPRLGFYLPPDTTIIFSIDLNMPDQFGNKLGKAAIGKIITTDYTPELEFTPGPGIVEAYGDKRVPVQAINYPVLPVNMAKIPPDEIIPLLQNENLFSTQSAAPVELPVQYIVNFGAVKNKWHLQPIELRTALGADSTGIVLTEFNYTRPGRRQEQQMYMRGLYQVTHLGITGKFSPRNNLVFVTNMKDASPVNGVAIEVRDDQNMVLWSGVTDAQGRCETPGWAELGVKPKTTWQPPRLWIFAKKSGDFAFLHSEWGTGIYPYRFGIDYEWNPQPLVRTGIVMTDRGLYRAGETVYFKGLMREKDGTGEWRVPRQTSWEWRIEDSRNQEVAKKMIQLSDYGAFDDSLKLDENASLGLYWMSLGAPSEKQNRPAQEEEYYEEDRSAIATGSFRVEAFRPAEFAVTALATNLINAKRGYISGEAVTAKISGRYLFGSPMRHAPLKWRLQLLPSYFSSKKYPEYTFRQWRRWSEESEYHGSQLLASGADSLDANGEISLSGKAIPTGIPRPQKLLIEGEVTSPSGQALAGSATVPVHPAEFYIGLRTDGYFFATNKSVACSLVAITPDDQLAAGTNISLRLIHRQWHSVRKAGFGGRYSWESTVEETAVDSSMIISAAQPLAYSFTPAKAGYYIVEASATDSRGNSTKSALFFYVSGAGYVAWERSDDDRVELVPNRRRYQPGDTATIMVQSPFEKCRALITIERESIFESRVVELNGTAPTIEVPIKENYLPNVFVSVALLQGRLGNQMFSTEGEDIGKPQFKIGYTNLVVDPETRHLSVSTTSDREQYRPGDLVKIAVDVKGPNASGMQSEVTLAVVDVGVLSLIGYNLPDPFGTFYGPRPLSVRTSETLLHLIEQRNYGEKAEPSGGGGAFGGIETRADFRMTPLWLPALRTDANGHAEARFTLPGNLTTFRIMAMAHTRDGRFGNGSSEFQVNKPLLMQAAAPRFTRVGDRFEAGVAITNTTAQRGAVSLLLQARGVRMLGDSVATFELAPGESRAIRRPYFAEELGKAVYQFRARMKTGGEDFTDGLEISLPILVPQSKEVVATSGSTEDKTREMLQVPGDIFADAGTLELTAASTAMVGLRESVNYLFEYPYGCLEQRLSRVLPMILAHDLVEAFQLPALREADYREVIRKSLAELSRYQLANGGFTVWPGGSRDWDYLSALALYTMAQAQQNGFAVDKKILDPAKKYAKEQLRIEFDESRNYSRRSFYYTRALLLHALAMVGENQNDYLTLLFEQRESLPLDGRAHLLRAAALMKKPQMVTVLQTELMNKIKIAPTTAHFEEVNPEELWWCYYSSTRTTALALQALVETRAAFPMADKVVRWLMDKRKLGRWRTTQENSTVFEALATYLRAYEKDVPNFSAEIRIAGEKYLQEVFFGRTTETRKTEAALNRFQQNLQLPVDIEKTGAGRFYYIMRMTYFPMQPSPSRDEGISLKKEMRKLESSNGQTSSYKPGDVVEITLRIASAQERHFVVVDDPLPAGFEAINPRLKMTASAYQEGRGRASSGWWRSGFDHVERRDDRVLLFASILSPGEHVFTYLARATTPGTFTLPSSHVEEMYTPEVFGKFQGGVVEIK